MSIMKEPKLRFRGDSLYCDTPIPRYGSVYRTQLVMTKEIFIECYKRWIEEPEEKCSGWVDYTDLNNEVTE